MRSLRNGSGRNRRTHRVTGQPVATTARCRCPLRTAATTSGTPAASDSASVSGVPRPATAPLGVPGPPRTTRPAATAPPQRTRSQARRVGQVGRRRRTTSADRRADQDRRSATRFARSARSSARPAPVRAETPRMGTPVSPSSSSSRRRSPRHRSTACGRQPVDLVEHDDHHVPVPGQRPQVALVHRRVGVLLRVEHPDQQVDQLHQPVDLQPVRQPDGVVVGQVEQDQPGRVGVAAACRSVPAGDLQPVEQRTRRPSRPTARPARSTVVGRRDARRRASSSPASALNSEDLPLPVAPASADHGVRPPTGCGRAPARADHRPRAGHHVGAAAAPRPARPPPAARPAGSPATAPPYARSSRPLTCSSRTSGDVDGPARRQLGAMGTDRWAASRRARPRPAGGSTSPAAR